MCKELCEDAEGGHTCCPNCGRMICWNIKYSDDVFAPAYVTASGDLFCWDCGRAMDEAEEAEMEWEAADYPEFDPYEA